MEHPPNCITLADLPPEVSSLFMNAFAPSGAQTGRPTAAQWVHAFDALGHQLKKCSTNSAHSFYRALSACPWCAIEVRAGIFLFVAHAPADGASRFNAQLIWTQIASVQGPGPGTLPDFSRLTTNISATVQARAAGWRRRGLIVGIVVVVLAVLGVCLAAGFGAGTFWVGVVCFAIAKGAIQKAGQSKTKFENEARAMGARYRATAEQWQREASDTPFKAKMEDLRKLTQEHGQLPSLRQRKIQDLERDLYNVQLRHFLEQFDIASANIPHVKDGRKAMLSSFGIDDAADVTSAAVEAVPGFGQFLTGHIMNWRRSLESKFRFDPKRGIDPADIQHVDQEITKRRTEIELQLSRGHLELAEVRRRTVLARTHLQDQLQKAWREMAQAQANARAA